MTTHTPIVFIAHDRDETRRYVQGLIDAVGLTTRAFSDAATLLEELRGDHPGCVVIGARLSSLRAADVQEALSTSGACFPFIVIASNGDVESAVAALKAGATDVVDDSLLAHRLVPVVLRAIAANLAWRSSRLEHDDVRLRYTQLTPRECEVLQLVVEGQTSGSIAKRLGICEKTVEIYRSHINKKMRVRNAVQLTRIMRDVT